MKDMVDFPARPATIPRLEEERNTRMKRVQGAGRYVPWVLESLCAEITLICVDQ